ncbi:hypothetical protein H1R16_08740 [Marnyiella aurantia]|uniref:Uncharacterized protein n=2 Tax=Marnyiella aurantia TaxID=2758037 RepID=A0A7D7LLQ1_9FLAO|nr:hypothetical protein [Marnyiella aurantia]MBA5246851.1 hypothetical protein [Marnyiella aurantia]MBP0612068.1 hypothetical protein [Marnyiella aurantia]QMS97804.1 hypothetical protein H1R16_08740 [Marnyiella aurantia]
MRIWSLITLAIFLNFMALPSMAATLGWDIPVSTVMVSEEETQHGPLVLHEKTIPSTLNVHDFLKLIGADLLSSSFLLADDSVHLSPFLSIFSPPPEF